jgi:hypothetical protein
MKRRDFINERRTWSSNGDHDAVVTRIAKPKQFSRQRTCIRSATRRSKPFLLGKKLEAATNGLLSIQMFPSMQLGGKNDRAALQIARISVIAVGPVVDDVNVFNMPFVFRNSSTWKVIDGEIGDDC